jgi:hypothetical protein
LKGGIIGILLPLTLIFIFWIFASISCSSPICLVEFFNIAGGGCGGCYSTSDWIISFVILIVLSFVFFLVGSLIGWIYGKIKK